MYRNEDIAMRLLFIHLRIVPARWDTLGVGSAFFCTLPLRLCAGQIPKTLLRKIFLPARNEHIVMRLLFIHLRIRPDRWDTLCEENR